VFRRGARKSLPSDTTAVVVPADSIAFPVVNAEKQQLMQSLLPLWNRTFQFGSFSAKAKMHYEGRGAKHDFTAHFRIKKDQVIWVSVTALGGIMQVARIRITPDSFHLVNYIDKEFTALPLAEAIRILPVPADFATLQNLVVGGVLRVDGIPTDATNFGGTLSLQVAGNSLVQQASFNKSDSTLRVLQMQAGNEGGPSGLIQFGNYELLNGQQFAGSRTVNLVSNGEQYYLDMNFNNVELDKELDFPFSIPKNYKRK
jgi:hypothetical protein